MTDAEKSCLMCGKSNPIDAQRCLHCGASLTSPQSSGAATSPGPSSQGPGCVVAYALMLGFGGISSAFIGLLFLSEALRRFSLGTALALGYFFISGIALLSIAWGLFKYRNWARVGVMVALPLGMLATFLLAATGGNLLGALIQLGIGGYILHWFGTHPQYFEVVEPEEFVRDIRWPVGISVAGYLIGIFIMGIANLNGQYQLSQKAAATAQVVNAMATRQAAAAQAKVNEFDLGKMDYPYGGGGLASILSPEGTQIIIRGTGGLNVVDIATGKNVAGFGDQARGMFSPDGREVVTFGSEVQFWDRPTQQKLASISGILDIIYSPTGRTFITFAYKDKTNVSHPISKVWDAQTHQELFSMGGESGATQAVYSPDGAHIISYHPYKGTYLWDVESGESVQLYTNTGSLGGIAFSPDGKQLFVAQGVLKVWDISTKHLVKEYRQQKEVGFLSRVVQHPYESSVAISSREGVTAVLNTETWQSEYQMAGHDARYSPDGRNILTIYNRPEERGMKIRDSATGREIAIMPGDVVLAEFTRDGRYLVTFNRRVVVVWDTRVLLEGGTFPFTYSR
jgi:hypothetical protein